MTEHRKVDQFWESDSGNLVTGRAHPGYYVICSCGAELWCGPDIPSQVPQPERLEFLHEKETLSPEEETERRSLWQEWHERQRLRHVEVNVENQERMHATIAKHAQETPNEHA